MGSTSRKKSEIKKHPRDTGPQHNEHGVRLNVEGGEHLKCIITIMTFLGKNL